MQVIVDQDYRRLDGSIAAVGETLEESDAFAFELIGANKVRPVNPADLIPPQPAAGASAFTELTDVPASYADAGGKLLKVKSSADGLEFVSPAEDAGAVEFTELTDVPSAYTAQGGKFVAVKSDVSGLEFVAAPEGATAFTDLTDAPATITADALVIANHAADALIFSPTVTIDSSWNVLKVSAAGEQANVYLNSGTSDLGLYVTETGVSLETDYGSKQFSITLDDDGLTIQHINSNPVFTLYGFDVVASDASAHMTVAGVQYSIAKAIKVQIGDDTYFWPLFGPVVP